MPGNYRFISAEQTACSNDVRSGGWWSNKNGEQRACVTCARLFPKAFALIVQSEAESRNFREVPRVLHLAVKHDMVL